jgi:hypothetical protein
MLRKRFFWRLCPFKSLSINNILLNSSEQSTKLSVLRGSETAIVFLGHIGKYVQNKQNKKQLFWFDVKTHTYAYSAGIVGVCRTNGEEAYI